LKAKTAAKSAAPEGPRAPPAPTPRSIVDAITATPVPPTSIDNTIAITSTNMLLELSMKIAKYDAAARAVTEQETIRAVLKSAV